MNKQRGFGTLFGLLLFLLIFFIYLYLYSQYKSNRQNINDLSSKKEKTLGLDNTLKGYYGYIDRIYLKDGISYKCHSLVVLGGDEYFIKDLKKDITFGEEINFIDKNKNLVINLPWTSLDGEQKNYIAKSNPYNLVDIKLIQKEHSGDNPPCYSEFEIVKIER